MNKQNVYEALFKTLQDALDWGYDSDTQFAWYAGGVIDFAEELLREDPETEPEKITDMSSGPAVSPYSLKRGEAEGYYDYQ